MQHYAHFNAHLYIMISLACLHCSQLRKRQGFSVPNDSKHAFLDVHNYKLVQISCAYQNLLQI